MPVSTINDTCSICLDSMTPDQELISHKGQGEKHPWHKECIIPWLKNHSTCPVCREELDVDALGLKDRISNHQEIQNDLVAGAIISIVSTTLLMAKGYPSISTPFREALVTSLALAAATVLQYDEFVPELTKRVEHIFPDIKSSKGQEAIWMAKAILSAEMLAIGGGHIARGITASLVPSSYLGEWASAAAMIVGGTAATVINGMLKRR
jgi:Ring finger domain